MMPLKPRDNALFVRNFRERLRPHVVGSYAALLFAALLIFLLLSAGKFLRTGADNAFLGPVTHCVPADVLAAVAIFQGVVLLLLGTLSAYRMALQDRLNGTLDFFRATPTEGFNHVIGLVFGAPVTEWFIFLLLVPVTFALALMSDVRFAALLEFYASLALCAVFYHSLGILAGVSANRQRCRASIYILFWTALLGALTAALIAVKSSLAYHSTFLPCYTGLLTDSGMLSRPGYLNYGHFVFFGKLLPSLPLQALVQLPLCAFVWLMVRRKIASMENPVLARPQLFALILLVLFYTAGDSLNVILYTLPFGKEPNPVLSVCLYLVFFLSVVFSVLTAPTALGYRKALSRAKKSGLEKPHWCGEQTSNTCWTAAFCVLSGLIYIPLCARFNVSYWISFFGFAVLAAFIVSFTNAFEFFRLSAFRGKTIIFSTAVLILWVALPITEGILTGLQYPFFFCLSPLSMLLLWGGFLTTDFDLNAAATLKQGISALRSSNNPPSDLLAVTFIASHALVFVIAAVFVLLAARARKRIRTGSGNGSQPRPADSL